MLFPDTLGYLRQSHGIVQKVRGLDVPYWSYEIMRSEIYAATLGFLHHGANLWPIVGLQALLTAWVLWLVVRSVRMPHPVRAYGVISAGLVSLTGITWYVSALMPDILGPLAYLSLLLVILVPESLRRWETGALTVLTLWCVTAHATHLLLAVAMCMVLGALRLLKWPGMVDRGPQIVLAVCILGVAVVAQLLVHRRLYHEASLYGRPPAFLMARLLGDGPARLYLQGHCAGSAWLICRDPDKLPTDGEVFLWAPGGIQATATLPQQKELRREEVPLLLATLHVYPRQQLRQSVHNFLGTLVTMGPWDYWRFAAFTPDYLDMSVPGLSVRYSHTLQAQEKLPQRPWRDLQVPLVGASLLVVLVLLPLAWRRQESYLLTLTVGVLFTVLANAFVSGVVSGVFPRYQGRIAWMIPFVAGLLIYATVTERRRPMVLAKPRHDR